MNWFREPVDSYATIRFSALIETTNMPTLEELERMISSRKQRLIAEQELAIREDAMEYARLKAEADSLIERLRATKKRLVQYGFTTDGESGELIPPKNRAKRTHATLKPETDETVEAVGESVSCLFIAISFIFEL